MSIVDKIASDFIYIHLEGGPKEGLNGVLGKEEGNRESDIKLWVDKSTFLAIKLGVPIVFLSFKSLA